MFRYNDGAPQLVAGAIERRAGMPLDVFAEENLFRPLGIRNWKWERAKDGVAFGAFGLYLTTRDAARFGQFLLQNGRWNGITLVDSAYMREATSPLVTADAIGTPYGYYFWLYPASGGYAAIGHGGQYIMVVPQKDLVVVYTAWPYTDGKYFDNFNQVMDLILRSCH
jgi:CubicO group peptidase (beta-lactamase class C family)